jgi:hypothetical protein
MSFLTKIEAAIKLGVGIELIDYYTNNAPKIGEDVKLESIEMQTETSYDETKLKEFSEYLKTPWPIPPSGRRPSIPAAIKDDIKQESHFACAICGHMDNGEVAHINAVSNSLNCHRSVKIHHLRSLESAPPLSC